MAFLNRFLNRKSKKENPKREVRSSSGKAPEGGEEKRSVVSQERKTQVREGDFSVLLHSHITEKSAGESGNSRYTFVVSNDANKREVKKAVEGKFGVVVTQVHVSHMPRKMRRRGRQIGWRSGFKKAIVTLEKGTTIDLQ